MDIPQLTLFAQAVLIGLSIAAPVGPIGLLCIQRSLDGGFRLGFATGLGAACADGLYGAIGAFGVHGVTTVLQAARPVLGVGGGLFLLWLGWQTWRQPATAHPAAADRRPSAARAWAGTALLTLSNPITILAFVGIFAALGGAAAGTAPGWMVLGVFAGSALWWLLLAGGVSLLHRRLPVDLLRHLRRASALLLAAFGAWAMQGALRG